MTDNVPLWVSVLVSFLPWIIYCGAIFWLGGQIRRSMTTRDGRPLAQVVDDFTKELKRTNELRNGN